MHCVIVVSVAIPSILFHMIPSCPLVCKLQGAGLNLCLSHMTQQFVIDHR